MLFEGVMLRKTFAIILVLAAAASAQDAVQPRTMVVHVFVALADNAHQGIVPAPESLGNGQDPANNLYWGAMYGCRTFFARSTDWKEFKLKHEAPKRPVIDRALFVSADRRAVVLMWAYDGRDMKAALTDFLNAAAGKLDADAQVIVEDKALPLPAGGKADMVCFVGHNGLMDIKLADYPARDGQAGPKNAVVLACRSRSFFADPLKKAGCVPLITTTGLMAPEAYTLDAIVRSKASGDAPEVVREKAAAAYAAYQKCSKRAALALFAIP